MLSRYSDYHEKNYSHWFKRDIASCSQILVLVAQCSKSSALNWYNVDILR
ncbi:MAG: hypothetical protein IMF12_10180 [Proteobacteria bacterium]|nr:hypothetical protein [Pseudomonadota bacterium]